MKRKTNLFYNTGQDSKFVTFSNYTEALTGNFLSTNTKLFPSVFLCLNVPKLNTNNEDVKRDFIINTLISRYENKLATLRDNISETNILPLNYLLEYLYKYDNTTTIEYIGNITEQDYLGAYTDTICTIDTELFQNAKVFINENINPNNIEGEDKLYGWWEGDTYLGPSIYKNINPIFDSSNSYTYNSGLIIELNKPSKDIKKIKFNVLIPLFTFVNIKDKFEFADLEEEYLQTTYNRNVPLGMWFANDYIELVSDNLYGQSWSLAIGSQFKPLPTEQQLHSDITKTSNAEAFQTFAQILTRQNQLIDVVKKSISTIEIQNQIDNTNPYTDEERAEVSKIPYKQDTLISGQNIKTINGQSLLGRGNIVIKADVNINDIIFDTLDTSKLSYEKVYSNKFVNQLLNSLESKINNTINSNFIYQSEINNDLYNKIDDNSDALIALTDRVTNNENIISKHTTTIDNITDRIAVLEENVDEIINNSIPTIQVDINKIQNDIKGINDSIDDIEELVETNSEDISELKDFVENLSIEAISEATINRIYKEIFI
jgi:hypothetical protein